MRSSVLENPSAPALRSHWRRVLRRELQRRGPALLEIFSRLRRNPDAENIHEFRVQTRQTRALLSLLRAWTPRRHAERLRRGLHPLFKRCARVRDTQVLLEILNAWTAPCPAVLPLVHHLRIQQAKLLQRLARALRPSPRNRLRTAWQACADDILQALESGDRVAAAILRARLDRAAARAAHASQQPPTPESLHRARIACKRLRYQLEILEPALPQSLPRTLDRLKKLQSHLGRIQDLQVALDRVERYADTASRRESLSPCLDGLRSELARRTPLAWRALHGFIRSFP